MWVVFLIGWFLWVMCCSILLVLSWLLGFFSSRLCLMFIGLVSLVVLSFSSGSVLLV